MHENRIYKLILPSNYMDSEIELSKELCEVIGAFMGDGNIYNNKNCHYRTQFSGDSRLDLEYYEKRICPIIQNIFCAKPNIKKVKGKNAIRVNFYSKNLYFFFREFLNLKTERKTHVIRIPDFFFNSSNKIKLNHLVRGLFDTDGGVFLDKRKIYKTPYPRWFFHTVSEELHEQLKEYLSKHFNIYTYRRKYKFPNNSDSFAIEIYGKEQLKKWMNLIGFSNPRHSSKVACVA